MKANPLLDECRAHVLQKGIFSTQMRRNKKIMKEETESLDKSSLVVCGSSAWASDYWTNLYIGSKQDSLQKAIPHGKVYSTKKPFNWLS